MTGPRNFKTFVVINPNSSAGETGRRWPEMAAALEGSLGKPVDFAETQAPLDAARLAREALRAGYEMIVSVGGDGTNNEVVNGFFDEEGALIREGAVLGLLPSGTGGDFRKSAGLGTDIGPNAAVLAGRRTMPLDVGRVSFVDHEGRPATRFFVNITSFGIGGTVDAYVNHTTKALGGRVSFFLGAGRAMFSYRNKEVALRLDGGPAETTRINNIAVANGQFFGGGMHVAPAAATDDGLFDVVTFGDMTKLEYIKLARSIYQGTHIGKPKVHHSRARVVEAESPEEVLIDMDGEQPGRLPIRLEVLPGALRLKVAG